MAKLATPQALCAALSDLGIGDISNIRRVVSVIHALEGVEITVNEGGQ